MAELNSETWEHFFKPEVRSSGRVYFAHGNVAASRPSDTEVQAYIRGSTSYKVNFRSESMASPLITVDCTCPASKKGQFCKHIWATLLKIEDSYPDYLDGKTEIEKREFTQEATAPAANSAKPQSQARIEAQEAYKAKQADYRKQQYQRQKQRLKDQKQAGKVSKHQVAPQFPEDVAKALKYFSQNGFELEESLNAEALRLAKKQLSRVFHPDKGGSHSEIVDLNRNYEVLISFVDSGA